MKIKLSQLRELISEQVKLFINESRSKDIKDYYEEVIDEVLSELNIKDKFRDKISDFIYKTDRDVEEDFSLGHSANNCAKNIIKKYKLKLKGLIKEHILLKEDSAGKIELLQTVTIKHKGKNIKFAKGDTFVHYRSGGWGADYFVRQGVYYDANEFPKGSYKICI